MVEFRAARLAETAQQVERSVLNHSREVNVRERYVRLRIALDQMRLSLTDGKDDGSSGFSDHCPR
jgi:hypothetical protein